MYNGDSFKAWKRQKTNRRYHNYRCKKSFYSKKEINESPIKKISNPFRLKKEKNPIKDRVIRGIRNLFEHEEEENYYKPAGVANCWSNSYTEYHKWSPKK